MSMQTWTEDGFGYELYNADNFETVKNFCIREAKKNPNPHIRFAELEKAEDSADLDDALNQPVPCFIAEILNKKEDTDLFAGYMTCGDTDAPDRIGITTVYPWQIKEKDRKRSQEEWIDILKKNAIILGIKENPDYFSHEYFG